MANGKNKRDKLEKFQQKLASLKFLDPACGSGNFLTETYVSLRRLENKVIEQLTHGQMLLGLEEVNPIKVSIHQFYGIEINDFAVTVAKTALWIAEAQMMAETEKIIRFDDDYLPLKTYNNIAEGNALRMDWNEVCPAEELDYIIGNPPFVGARMKSKEQADDLLDIFGKKWKNLGNIDYVGGWYLKASQMMRQNPDICTALVSTNSITQGEQVANLWKPLFDEFGIHIDFAYPTFRWDSESTLKAHVHCVIVGFSQGANKITKRLYNSEGQFKECRNINAYLIDAPNVFVDSRKKLLCNVPEMVFGSMPNDAGVLSDYSEEQRNNAIKKYPEIEPYFRKLLGAQEYINGKSRYCLWLLNATPNLIKSIPFVYEAVMSVKGMRLNSNREGTRKLADVPHLFGEIRQPIGTYIIVPRVSSEKKTLCSNGIYDS